MKLKLVILLMIGLTASGALADDWPMFGGDSLHSRFAPETSDTLYNDVLWTFETQGPIFSSPVCA